MKTIFTIFGVLSFFLAASLSAQTIYKWKDEKGQWHFGQNPPANAIAVERRDLPTPKPEQLPKDEPCETFKVGETRTFKTFKPSPDFPHLQTKDFQMRLIEKTAGYSTFSWRLTIANTAIEREGIRGTIGWKDCDDFALAEMALTPTAVIGGGEETLTGNKTIFGPAASRIGRFRAAISGQNPVGVKQEAKKPESYLKPRVSVIATNLYRAVDTNVYFSGKVYNAGSATARNVRVFFTIKNQSGNIVERNSVSIEPDDLKPGGEGIFQKTVLLTDSPSHYSWFTEVEQLE